MRETLPSTTFRAFDEYAERHGRARTVAVLQNTTGAREVYAVREVKIIVAMAELIGSYSFGLRPVDKVARLHAELAAIREKAFAGRLEERPTMALDGIGRE